MPGLLIYQPIQLCDITYLAPLNKPNIDPSATATFCLCLNSNCKLLLEKEEKEQGY